MSGIQRLIGNLGIQQPPRVNGSAAPAAGGTQASLPSFGSDSVNFSSANVFGSAAKNDPFANLDPSRLNSNVVNALADGSWEKDVKGW
jgi:hypothetical protein